MEGAFAMIYNQAYVKRLIRKELESGLTGKEAALLRAAWMLYDEDELLVLEMQVLRRLAVERTAAFGATHCSPGAGELIRRERRQRLRQLLGKVGKVSAGVAAVLLMGLGIWAASGWWQERTTQTGYQMLVLPGDRIPSSEFACTVHWGDSAAIAVGRDSRGRLGRLGNMELWRHGDGELELRLLQPLSDVYTWTEPDIRITTGAQQQSTVRLPDGSLVRLDAGSTLSFPMEGLSLPNTTIGLSGQALVRVSRHADRRPETLTVETANGSVTTRKGEFSVLANKTDTRVVLLDGRLEGEFPIDNGHRTLTRMGDGVTYDRCCTDEEGKIKMILSEVEQEDPRQAVAWTTKSWNYRDVPLRAFVAEMNRKYDLGVESVNCIPEHLKITASIHFKDPVAEIFAHIRQAGVVIYEGDGMISFCGPELDHGQPQSPDELRGPRKRVELMEQLHGKRLAWNSVYP